MSPARAAPPAVVPYFAGRVPGHSPPVPTAFPWPYQGNTGYLHAPGYPGSLTTYGGGALTANTTYSFVYFPGGPPDVLVSGVTFYGCLMSDTNPAGGGIITLRASGTTTVEYCTIQPSSVSVPRVTGGVNFADSFQYCINQVAGAGRLVAQFCDMWGFGEAIQISDPSGSSNTQQMFLSDNYVHDPSDQGTGASMYHVDGFLCNNGGISYLTVNHNTISWPADTNALALQSADGTTLYDHITVTNNYFGGFGYMVNMGGHTLSTNMTFTGNVWADYAFGYNGFTTDDEPGFGPFYDSSAFQTHGLGNWWQGNRYWAKRGTWLSSANDGLYWWPSDLNPSGPSSVIGHATDYVNP